MHVFRELYFQLRCHVHALLVIVRRHFLLPSYTRADPSSDPDSATDRAASATDTSAAAAKQTNSSCTILPTERRVQ
jgi:hypothetical protein